MAATKMPSGVYFCPEPEEMVCNYLHRLITGEHMPDTEGVIFRADVYDACPDELVQRYPPSTTRDFVPAWFFFSQSKFQNVQSKRSDRSVGGGGHWRLDQTRTKIQVDKVHVGTKASFGFYRGRMRDEKSAWLMEEYSSVKYDGAGERTKPVLCTIYVSPIATDAQKRDAIERGAPIELEPKKKTARVMVSDACFDAVAALLPPSRVRTAGRPWSAW